MALTKIEIPDFTFSGFYYPEILQDLIQYNRVNVPEITDESPEEPFIQLLRSFSLTGHLNNVLLDLVAKERFLATASLRSSVRAHLALIDVTLKQASPAEAQVLMELSQTFPASQTLVPVDAEVSTQQGDTAAITYESLAAFTMSRTDQLSKCFSYDASLDSWADHTAEAISASGNFSPVWTGGPAVGDLLYIGHTDILWDKLNVVIATGGTIASGVWEFYDGNLDYIIPALVVNNGSNITFMLNNFLGAEDMSGTQIRVKNVLTGGFEDLVSTYASGNNQVTTVALLGQSGTPSTTLTDYIVGSAWKPLLNVTDDTTELTSVGSLNVTYELPETLTELWQKVAVGSLALSTTAYWLRFRVTVGAGATNPSITQIRLDTGKQYAFVTFTQGITRSDSPLGSSTGLPDQQFQLANLPVLDDDNLHVFVTESVESEWTRVENFLNSTNVDTHYRVEFDDDGRALVIFGDGITGKVPSAGTNNIRATYRTMEEVDGNVGQNTITINKSGMPFLNKLYNPRPAEGYVVREGMTDADLARLKITGPASLRTKDRAVTTPDVETLAAAFVNSAGTRPIGRALAIEESFGPKTVEIVVVGPGGTAVSQADRDELAASFNGDPATKTIGKIVMNHAVTVTNFSAKPVNVTATIYGGNQSAVLTALAALLSPVSTNDDGVTFSWDFGGEVPLSKIIAAIQDTTPRPRKVTVTVPASDTSLGTRELPVAGTLLITPVA